MGTRHLLLSLLILSILVLAAVSVVEIDRVGALESDNANLSSDVNRLNGSISYLVSGEYCFQTGLHGELWVRVVADGTGEPIQGASVTALILNYCQEPAYALNTVQTNESGYAVVPTDWVGNFTITVTSLGGIYSFTAWTGASINLATLSIPSGVSNVTVVSCLGLGCD